jgi:hypothetical protein
MNLIYRLIVLLGTFGLTSPLLAESPTDPTQPVTTVRDSPSRAPAHPGEKVAEVDPRTLPTSGTDVKFQGTLMNLGVKSIQEVRPVGEKARTGSDEDHKSQTNTTTVSKADGDKAASKEKSSSVPTPAPKVSPATNR